MLFFFLGFVAIFALFIFVYWFVYHKFFNPKPVLKFKALSIVYPSGTKIARGEKTIEVRSWRPPEDFNEDLLLIENKNFLRQEGETDPDGTPIAIVKIKNVRPFTEADITAACATRWEPEYYSWELTDVRPITNHEKIIAARGIYEVELKSKFSDKYNS